MWRVWIEIGDLAYWIYVCNVSPSVWRVWIEIVSVSKGGTGKTVTLRVEGVD